MSDYGPRRYRIPGYAAPSAPPSSRWCDRRGLRAIAIAGCWLYLATVLGFWAGVSCSRPEFWPFHLLLYGPRWLLFLPALALVPSVAWLRLRWPALALGMALTLFVGISGLNVPWRNLVCSREESPARLRLLTCNVQRGDLRTDELARLVREAQPDVILLQECSLEDPHAIVDREGWHVRSAGEFCLASRHPIVDFEVLRRPDKLYRIVAVRATVSCFGELVPVVSVHLMTPRRGLEAIIGSPLEGIGAFREVAAVQRFESGLVRHWIEQTPGLILVAGDFNLTVEHPVYRRDWSDYRDAFSWASWGFGHTMFTRLIGLRIDHILCGIDWRPTSCWVGPDVGSAHRPIIADLTADLRMVD